MGNLNVPCNHVPSVSFNISICTRTHGVVLANLCEGYLGTSQFGDNVYLDTI